MTQAPPNLSDLTLLGLAAVYYGDEVTYRPIEVRTTGPHTAGVGLVSTATHRLYVVEVPVKMTDGSRGWREVGRGHTIQSAVQQAVSRAELRAEAEERRVARLLEQDRADGYRPTSKALASWLERYSMGGAR